MIDLLKQDCKIGDTLKLYLTTGKEPEGIIVEFGDNFVLIQTAEGVQNRIFDKLIGA